MKKYNNFCITWNENGAKREEVILGKADAIRRYIELLFTPIDTGKDISSLSIYGVTRKYLELENITFTVNRFLSN